MTTRNGKFSACNISIYAAICFSLLWAIACVPALLPAGAGCENTEECEEGLECIPFATHANNTCEEGTKSCTKYCDNNDEDCADLEGEYEFICFALCDDRFYCGQDASQ